MSDSGRLRLERIDPAKLKLKDLVEIERLLGRKLGAEFTSGEIGVDTLQALVFIQGRQSNPAFTFEQAGDIDLGTLIDAMSDEDETEDGSVDPTPATPSVPATSAERPANDNSKPTPSSTISGG